MFLLSVQLTGFEIAIVVLASLFLPVMIWMMYTSIKVNSTYNKYNNVSSSTGLTAIEAARIILDRNGCENVRIMTCQGKLTDHYDPRNNTVYLSEATCNSTSIAAIGVAGHECGHAIQYAEGYLPVKIRTALVPVVNFTSKLSFPLILIAILLESLAYATLVPMALSNFFLILAVICYFVYMLFTFVTMPPEFDASRRARRTLEETGVLSTEEVKQTGKVLNAAAMTYVASFIMSLVQLCRLLVILISRKNNDS